MKASHILGILSLVILSTSCARICSGQARVKGFYEIKRIVLSEGQTESHPTIRGVVKDRDSGRAIPYANVWIEGSDVGTTTKEDGSFALLFYPSGQFRVKVSSVGNTEIITSDLFLNESEAIEIYFFLGKTVIK